MGKFTLFAVLFPLLLGAIARARSFLHFRGTGLRILLGNLLVTLAALILTAAFARFEGQRFGSFGLGEFNGRNALAGAATGLALLTMLLLTLHLFSGFRPTIAVDGRTALESGALYAVIFAAVALAEESLWRGYALVRLSSAPSSV